MTFILWNITVTGRLHVQLIRRADGPGRLQAVPGSPRRPVHVAVTAHQRAVVGMTTTTRACVVVVVVVVVGTHWWSLVIGHCVVVVIVAADGVGGVGVVVAAAAAAAAAAVSIVTSGPQPTPAAG